MTAFQAYVRPLETVMSYKYLGRLITATDNDIPEVIDNLQKAQNIWSRLLRVLVHEGTDAWASVFFTLP